MILKQHSVLSVCQSNLNSCMGFLCLHSLQTKHNTFRLHRNNRGFYYTVHDKINSIVVFQLSINHPPMSLIFRSAYFTLAFRQCKICFHQVFTSCICVKGYKLHTCLQKYQTAWHDMHYASKYKVWQSRCMVSL